MTRSAAVEHLGTTALPTHDKPSCTTARRPPDKYKQHSSRDFGFCHNRKPVVPVEQLPPFAIFGKDSGKDVPAMALPKRIIKETERLNAEPYAEPFMILRLL